MPSQPPEYYFAKLKAEKPTFESESWTEADTRSKYIDRLLIECLGWREVDIHRELDTSAGRLDYILRVSTPVVIVEAKRANERLYTRKSNDPYRVKLKTLFGTDPGSKPHILQAQNYCAAHSVPVAIVTNGRAFVAFLATRVDGVPWVEGDALIFPDIFADNFNFSELHNHLSRDAIIAGTLQKRLRSEDVTDAPRDALSAYPDPTILIAHNPLGRALEPVLRPLFSQLANPESLEVLRHCYVLPPISRSKEPDLERLLRNRVPHFAPNATTIDSRSAFRQFKDTLNIQSGVDSPGGTILVIGSVGAGKTTFLRRFFDVELPENEDAGADARAVPLFVNFQTPPSDPTQIADYIYQSLRDQIVELDEKPVPETKAKCYDLMSTGGLQDIFLGEYQQFLKNEGQIRKSDPQEFERQRVAFLGKLRDNNHKFSVAAVRNLKKRYRRRVVVVIDNVDQCDADFQRNAYIFCQTLEHELGAAIVIALCEEWYWYHGVGREGPLSAYHNVTFHIPSPRMRDILERRLAYAIALLKQRRNSAEPILTPSGTPVEPKHLEMYISSCKNAFFRSDEIANFLEALANASIRKGLERFLDFVRSGHTHEHEYLLAFAKGEEYTIRFHQMFKSIAHGIYRHYSSDRSHVGNLFRPVFFGSDRTTYFLNIYLLRWMQGRIGISSPAGRGYIPYEEFATVIENFGIPRDLVHGVIEGMVRREWIVPDVPLPAGDIIDQSELQKAEDVWKFLRITAWGYYTIRHLAHRFAYLEAVMLDTPLHHGEFVERVIDTYGEGRKVSLDHRRPLVTEYVDILETIESSERGAFANWRWSAEFSPFMTGVKERLQGDLREIDQAAELMRAN